VDQELRAVLLTLLPRLRRFGIALTGSALDADDLVQDACERALTRSEQLRDRARIDAWLYGIMRNLWSDRLRARRLRTHDRIEAAEQVAGEDGEMTAEMRISLAQVRRALEFLSVEYRTVLTLVCVDGMSYRESAEILGIPIGTVMSRLARGRAELAERLASRAKAASVVPMSPSRNGMRPR
jgi:RNA polymerase sigma-70 factor (ECF subfamily)